MKGGPAPKKLCGVKMPAPGVKNVVCSRDPHRFEFPAKLERMIAPDVSQIFRGLEMLLAVVVDAALNAS